MRKVVAETVEMLDKVAVAVRGWVTVTVSGLASAEELIWLPDKASADETPLTLVEFSEA